MNLQFQSFAEFLAMNGHGPYVWSSYGITLGMMLLLLLGAYMQRRNFFRRQRKAQRLAEQQSRNQSEL